MRTFVYPSGPLGPVDRLLDPHVGAGEPRDLIQLPTFPATKLIKWGITGDCGAHSIEGYYTTDTCHFLFGILLFSNVALGPDVSISLIRKPSV